MPGPEDRNEANRPPDAWGPAGPSAHPADAASLHNSLYDGLTGLPNRSLMEERSKPVLARSRRDDVPAALMLLNILGLERINEAFGEEAGDQVLRATARRLELALRDSDIPARVEGGVLGAVLQAVTGDETLGRVARRVTRAVSEPVTYDGQDIDVGVRMGLAIYPHDAVTFEELLANARAALDRARALEAEFEFFENELSALAREKLRFEADLAQATDGNEFILHFQPIVSATTGQLVGAEALTRGSIIGLEALARWPHATRGLVMPGEFIPLAEATGRIVALDRWALAAAIGQAAAWWEQGWEGWVSVNLSTRSLRDPGLATYVDAIVKANRIEAERLVLEITESAAVRDPIATVKLLTKLKGVGVKIALDDFGTGHSSLAYLKAFPVDLIKLDQSFIADIGRDEKDERLIEAIVALAHRIGALIVAEGVEETRQMEWLRYAGCDLVQGYLLGEPGPAEGIQKW